jgi:hypothetical protein
MFAALFLALLAATAVWIAPSSLRAWRSGERPQTTPSARIGVPVAAAGAAGVGALWLMTPGLALDRPQVTVASVAGKMEGIVGRFQPWFLLPTASLGAIALRHPIAPSAVRGM